jgi:hypothetical protein
MPSLRPYPTFAWARTRGRPSRTIAQEVPRTKRRRLISCTTMGKPVASLQLQFILIHLRERFPHHLALAPTRTMAVGPASTSPGSMTQGFYVVSLVSATTSSTTAAMSSRGHNAIGQRLARNLTWRRCQREGTPSPSPGVPTQEPLEESPCSMMMAKVVKKDREQGQRKGDARVGHHDSSYKGPRGGLSTPRHSIHPTAPLAPPRELRRSHTTPREG